MTKIVCLADTHGIENIDIPDADILIFAGDITNMGTFEDVYRFNMFLKNQKAKHKIYIAGNHDWLYDTDPTLAPGLVKGAIYLRDEEVKVKGLRVFGTPWQPEFCNWAFNKDDQTQLPYYFKKIPEGLDILISHGPPYGILDTINDGPHLGSKALWNRIQKVRPKIVIFGHIHYSYGIQKKDGITYVNCAILNEAYEEHNRPVIIEINGGKVHDVRKAKPYKIKE